MMRRRSLLLSIKEIYQTYVGDMNYYDENKTNSVSLLSHVKELILERMLSTQKLMERQQREERKTQSVVYSSGSEADRQSDDNLESKELYQSVIDDYVGQQDQSGSLHKSVKLSYERASEDETLRLDRYYENCDDHNIF